MGIPANFSSSSYQPLILLLTVLNLFSFMVAVNLNSPLSFKLSSPLPRCPERCGNVQIGYPFGIGDGCFYPGFQITCNRTIPYLAGTGFQLLRIYNSTVRVNSLPFWVRFCGPNNDNKGTSRRIELPKQSPYTFSFRLNRFIVIGCEVMGVISDESYTISACTSACHHSDVMDSKYCTGVGCCEVTLPRVQKTLDLHTNTFQTEMRDNLSISSTCSNAFVVEQGSYHFINDDIRSFNRTSNLAMKLEWHIEGKCNEAKGNDSSICGQNSKCYESKRSTGYLCKCLHGYKGNPYLRGPRGCQTFDECITLPTSCVPEATCMNTYPGRYCICPAGTKGDGFKLGSGCQKHFQMIHGVIAVMFSSSIVVICLSWFLRYQKNRQLAKMRVKYFRQNGGLLLQQRFSHCKGTTTKHTRIFSANELANATNNYTVNRVLGSGGQGTVYKGILDDGSTVAIKKSQSVAQCQIDQFINELVILTQINHKNIVKLIGCCLETQVPLLVYEFIPGGTLYHKLHGDADNSTRLMWNDRLQVAIKIGDALSYLHSYACMPIFHRDVKSSNILLDADNTPKLADFGVSRLVPLNKGRVSTAVHGTIGYLDPEYFNTGKLTDKSDVYSFGVVLLELLTGRKPIRHEETQDYSSLVMHFQSYIESENLLEILDEMVIKEGKLEEMKVVAGVARRCLRVCGTERPTMKKVVHDLASTGRETP